MAVLNRPLSFVPKLDISKWPWILEIKFYWLSSKNGQPNSFFCIDWIQKLSLIVTSCLFFTFWLFVIEVELISISNWVTSWSFPSCPISGMNSQFFFDELITLFKSATIGHVNSGVNLSRKLLFSSSEYEGSRSCLINLIIADKNSWNVLQFYWKGSDHCPESKPNLQKLSKHKWQSYSESKNAWKSDFFYWNNKNRNLVLVLTPSIT